MNPVRIKLCGLMREADVLVANRLKPDYTGFVLAQGFRRTLAPETARRLRQGLAPGIQAVGVFVRESPEAIAAFLEEGLIDIAQLHGWESPETVLELKRLTSKPIIQAVRLASEADADKANASPADLVLLDAAQGAGRAFDWRLARLVHRPFLLAGGLNPGNVAEAIRSTKPFAVDVSSGIETDGLKDPSLMAAFVAAAREVTYP